MLQDHALPADVREKKTPATNTQTKLTNPSKKTNKKNFEEKAQLKYSIPFFFFCCVSDLVKSTCEVNK